MADGRVEIKFLTNTKELDQARKLVETLSTSIDTALQDKSGQRSGSEAQFVKLAETSETATQSVSNLTEEVKELNSQPIEKLPQDLDDVEVKATQATGGIKSLVTSLGLLKVVGMAISAITDNLDKAISRVDTMRQFPRMMEAVGFSATQSTQAIEKLSDGIDGLPTALDEVVATTQQLALTTGDLEQATELTLALNNAFLASGSTSADASRGLQQFSQMLSAGKVDMQSWRTLLETMPLALQTVAENMGYVGASAKNDLYDALQQGVITFDEFSQALIDASNAQGGFAELAKVNSEGIATSFTNIRTAVVKGVADAVIALDELVESVTGKNIAQHADTLKVAIGGAFKTISENIRGAAPFIQSAISLFQRATPVVTGLAVAFGAYKIITSVTSWFKTLNSVITVLNSTKAFYLGTTKALSLAQVSATGAQRALAMAIGLYTGNVTVATAVTMAFQSAISFLTGPIGLTITALGLLAGTGLYLKNAFEEATEGLQDYIEKVNDAVEDSKNLQTEVDNSATAFDDSITDIDNNSAALKRLTDKLVDLAEKEEKSATDKQILQGYVDELNGSVEGLNLTYDAETDALNLSKRAIYEKIDAMSDLARANLAYERITEIMKEQLELEAQIGVNMQTLQEMSGIPNLAGTDNDTINNLVEETKGLMETYNQLEGEMVQVESILNQSLSNIAATTESGTQRIITAFDDLSESQQQTIENLQSYYSELLDHTTNMFSQIEDVLTDSEGNIRSSSDIFSELESNLVHNQEVVATWAENMEALATSGISDGLLAALESLGAEGAPYVQALVDASETDLARLDGIFSQGGEGAIEALKTALNIDDVEIEGIEHIITNTQTSLKEQAENAEFDSVGLVIMEGIATGIKDNESELEDSVNQVIEKVPEWVETNIVNTNVKEPIENMFEGTTIDTAPVQSAVDEIPPVIDSIQPEAEESGKGIIDATTEGIESGTPELIQQEQSSIEQAVEVIDEYMDEAYDGGSRLMDETSSGIDSGAPAVAESSRSSAVGGVSAFRNGGGGAFGAGLNLGLGFRNGLESARQQIVSTASSIATAATNAINSALRIASPSKEGIYSGSMLGQGVAVGLDKEKSLVEKEAKELAKLAIPDFGSYDLNRILSFPTLTERTVSSGSNSGQVVDMSRTNELLERIYQKNPNLVADDGAIIGRYTNMFDRENGIIARNKSGRRLN